VCSAVKPGDAAQIASTLHARIDLPEATVLGPAPLFRLRGRSRSQLLIKARRRATTIRTVGGAVDRLAREASRRAVSISVDVDPQ
jgi:primosomal protein N' (replication factor Y)